MNSTRFWGPAVLCVSLLATGCGADPMAKENYDKIQNGMTIQEVSKLFGFEDVKELEGQLAILKNKAVSTSPSGVERTTTFDEENGYIIDTFMTKEMGNVNVREIHVRYKDGLVEWKDQKGVE